MICFEDLEPGIETVYGSYEMRREEMIEFARKFDPQPFHLSDEEAAKTHFGRLAASGFHTASAALGVSTRYFVEHGFQGRGSPGLDELLWRQPVHAGDRLTVTGTVLDKRESKSKPHIGLVRVLTVVTNQDDVEVMRFSGTIMVQRRAGDAA